MLYQTHIIRALYTQRVYIDKNLLYCFDVLIVVHNIYQKYTNDKKKKKSILLIAFLSTRSFFIDLVDVIDCVMR